MRMLPHLVPLSFIGFLLAIVPGVHTNTTIIETETDPSLDQETILYSTNETDVDPDWLSDALKDIAYYLRDHKFNEYDRRYETDKENASRSYFSMFPRPPLRSLHWEVHKSCEESFIDCIKYLSEKIQHTDARREDDTVVVMKDQKWTKDTHAQQISLFDKTCRENKDRDNEKANPFQGPLERYQWRVTASYYMCWFTMKELNALEHISESCDNFANCMDPKYGAANLDSRADDRNSFSCAIYSFCPDPCCPMKHLTKQEKCWNSADNPCFEGNPAGQRECLLDKSQNTDFRDIVLNRWNVSCKCPKGGYEWNSLYGMCIDVDECAIGGDDCDQKLEACVNLPGTYRCVCKWGHTWNKAKERCEGSPALATIALLSRGNNSREEEEENPSIVGRIRKYIKNIF